MFYDGKTVINKVKNYIDKFNSDNDKIQYLKDVKHYLVNTIKKPNEYSQIKYLKYDDSADSRDFRDKLIARDNAYFEIENWLNDNITVIESRLNFSSTHSIKIKPRLNFSSTHSIKIKPHLNFSNTHSFLMEDVALKYLPEFFKKLKESKCIHNKTKLTNFKKCFSGEHSSKLKSIIWIETLPLLIKLIIKLNENKLINEFENKTINLCFDDKIEGKKYGSKIKKTKYRLSNRIDYNIDFEREKILNKLLNIFNI